MTIPIEMPNLISGAGDTPGQGACVMQAVAWLASNGDEWTDAPACTHRVLRRVAIRVNDNITDTARRQLWPLVPRLLGTATGDRAADNRISVALAAWAAERVLPLIKDEKRHATAAERIGKARAWLTRNEPPAAAAADAYAADAYGGAADAYAAAGAAYAAYAADAYAYGGAAAADAYAAVAYAAYGGQQIKFLTDLLDEYDHITGRTTPPQITTAQWAALHDALTGHAEGQQP
jgi:hypothetical protein